MVRQKPDLIGFKLYVMQRKSAFETKYRLNGWSESDNRLRFDKYPNNLKYLDRTSQDLIRAVNTEGVDLRDKIVTCLVYTLIPDRQLLKKRSDKNGIFTLKRVGKLATLFDTHEEYIVPSYHTVITKSKIFGLSTGEMLMAVVEDFLEQMPKDNFYKYKSSEIYTQLTVYDPVFGLNDFIAYQMCSALSFIDELEVKIDMTHELPASIKKFISELLGKRRVKGDDTFYSRFIDEIMDWYSNESFLDKRERVIVPTDIVQMLMGYRYYINDLKGVGRDREPSKYNKNELGSIVITRSMYEYYK